MAIDEGRSVGEFRLLSYRGPQAAVAGVLFGQTVFDLADVLAGSGCDAAGVLDALTDWDRCHAAIGDALPRLDRSRGKPLVEVELLAPVLYPNAIYCAAANYRDHMHAMAMRLGQPDEPDPHERDIKPYHFVIPGRSGLAGPSDPVRMPSHGSRIDWEIELVAVIGRRAARVPVERALDHVAGYAIGNDVSVRDMSYLKIPNVPETSLFRTDFIGMKGFDGGCVVGPWLTPASAVPDPQALGMTLSIDGETMQDSSTAEMIFTVAEQIAYLSQRVTLLPGDMVMTGTPAGTGMERDRFLKAGETLRLSIQGLGEMTQRVVAN